MEIKHVVTTWGLFGKLLIFAKLMMLAVVSPRVASLEQQFYNDPGFDGKICSSVLFTLQADTLVKCLALCKQNSCGSFFINLSTQTCYGCSTSYSAGTVTLPVQSGTLYYSPNPVLTCVGACTTSINGYRLCDGGGAGVCDVTKGRLEVMYNGQWGTVCDDLWTSQNSETACKTLGYTTGYGKGFTVGLTSQPIYLDNVNCSASMTSLAQCGHAGWGNHNCGHDEDIGVECIACLGDSRCTTSVNNFRLCDGGGTGYCSPTKGRLEFYYNSAWGTVCDDSWEVYHANSAIACRTLGYMGGLYYSHAGADGQPIVMDNIFCGGSEALLSQCSQNTYGVHNCAHSEDIGINCLTCSVTSGCTNDIGGYRLCDGGGTSGSCRADRGRLEILYNGAWGTVCGDLWDSNSNNAIVGCRSVGHVSGITTTTLLVGSTETILLDEIVCAAETRNLTQCPNSGWLNHDCSHSEDIRLICT